MRPKKQRDAASQFVGGGFLSPVIAGLGITVIYVGTWVMDKTGWGNKLFPPED